MKSLHGLQNRIFHFRKRPWCASGIPPNGKDSNQAEVLPQASSQHDQKDGGFCLPGTTPIHLEDSVLLPGVECFPGAGPDPLVPGFRQKG